MIKNENVNYFLLLEIKQKKQKFLRKIITSLSMALNSDHSMNEWETVTIISPHFFPQRLLLFGVADISATK